MTISCNYVFVTKLDFEVTETIAVISASSKFYVTLKGYAVNFIYKHCDAVLSALMVADVYDGD